MGQKDREPSGEPSQERLGSAIRRRRVELGKSRKDLERETGLSYPYLTEIEAGKKWPSSKTLARIAEVLQSDPGDLMSSDRGFGGGWESPRPSHFHSVVGAASAPPPPAASIAPPEDARMEIVAPEAAMALPDEDSVAELTEIAESLPERDRQLLLDFARRLKR